MITGLLTGHNAIVGPIARDGVPPPPPPPDFEIVFRLPEIPEPTFKPSLVCNTYLGEFPCFSREEMQELLLHVGWPEAQIPTALRVARCESNYAPAIVNWGDQKDGLGSTGLFQLWSGWYAAAGYAYADYADPVVNATVALYVWETSGWHPWGCY
jgi:hypothetical protein